jgi:hypothetical protein
MSKFGKDAGLFAAHLLLYLFDDLLVALHLSENDPVFDIHHVWLDDVFRKLESPPL